MNKILIIEKDKNIADALNALNIENCVISVAKNDSEILHSIEEYELIIIDILNCENSGFSLLERINSCEKKIKTIFINDINDISINLQVLKEGGSFFIAKPIDFLKLRLIVEKLLKGEWLFKENINQIINSYIWEEIFKINEKLKQEEVFDITFLRDIDKNLRVDFLLQLLFQCVSRFIARILDAEYVFLMVIENKKNLVIKGIEGLNISHNTKYQILENPFLWIKEQENRGILNQETPDIQQFLTTHHLKINVYSQFSVSIVIDFAVCGLVKIINKKDGYSFTNEEKNFISNILGEFSIILKEKIGFPDNIRLFYINIIQTMMSFFEKTIFCQPDHSENVKKIAVQIASALKLPTKRIEDITYCAILHDIGKLGINRSIFSKIGDLDKKEILNIHRHSYMGTLIVRSIESLRELAPIIFSHHERFDGGGYPKGLKGENIPLESRILNLADAYEVMINGRIYKSPLSQEEIIADLKKNAGRQFDPKLVEICISLIKEGKI